MIRLSLEIIIGILNNDDNGSDSTRPGCLAFLIQNQDVIRLELALLEDAARVMATACYNLEVDGFIAPKAYNIWENVREQGRIVTGRNGGGQPPIAPTVREICVELAHGDAAREDQLFLETIEKAKRPYDKLDDDSRMGGRLSAQLQLFRAARILAYPFVCNALPNAALRSEIETYFEAVPSLVDLKIDCLVESEAYQRAAHAFSNRPDAKIDPNEEELWMFWKTHMLALPSFYAAATEMAIVFTSSACVERIFSLYVGMFNKEMNNTLEDRRAASVMLLFNSNQRVKYNDA